MDDWLSQFLSGGGGMQGMGMGMGLPAPPTTIPPDGGAGAPREGTFDASPLGQALAGGTGFTGAGGGGDFASRLTQGLRGVQAPPARDVVKPSTPSAPGRPPQMQGGRLLALMQALSQPRPAPQMGPTLGQSVGIGRY
jgi:hypothetical protein